jgi:hypothetical protein
MIQLINVIDPATEKLTEVDIQSLTWSDIIQDIKVFPKIDKIFLESDTVQEFLIACSKEQRYLKLLGVLLLWGE